MGRKARSSNDIEQARIDAAVALDEKNRLQADFNDLVLSGTDPESKRGKILIANAKKKVELVKKIEETIAVVKDYKNLEKEQGIDVSAEIEAVKEEEHQLRDKYWNIPEYGFLKGEPGAFVEKDVARPKLTVDFMLVRAEAHLKECLKKVRKIEKAKGAKPVKLDELLSVYFRKRRENLFVSEELSFLDIELRRFNAKLQKIKDTPEVKKKSTGKGRPPATKSEKIAKVKAQIKEVEQRIEEVESSLNSGERLYRAVVLERRKLKAMENGQKKASKKAIQEQSKRVDELQEVLDERRAIERERLDALEPHKSVDSVLMMYSDKLVKEMAQDKADSDSINVESDEQQSVSQGKPGRSKRQRGVQTLQ